MVEVSKIKINWKLDLSFWSEDKTFHITYSITYGLLYTKYFKIFGSVLPNSSPEFKTKRYMQRRSFLYSSHIVSTKLGLNVKYNYLCWKIPNLLNCTLLWRIYFKREHNWKIYNIQRISPDQKYVNGQTNTTKCMFY